MFCTHCEFEKPIPELGLESMPLVYRCVLEHSHAEATVECTLESFRIPSWQCQSHHDQLEYKGCIGLEQGTAFEYLATPDSATGFQITPYPQRFQQVPELLAHALAHLSLIHI